jgi:hypothetical protein
VRTCCHRRVDSINVLVGRDYCDQGRLDELFATRYGTRDWDMGSLRFNIRDLRMRLEPDTKPAYGIAGDGQGLLDAVDNDRTARY